MGDLRASSRRILGLTLVELMVALSIMTILGALAIPEFARQISRWKLQTSAERLASDLSETREQAQQRRRAQYVTVAGGEQWCWAVSEAPNCPCGEARACQRHRVAAPSASGIVIAQEARFRFDPAAPIATQAAPQSVLLQSMQGERLQVVMTPLGRARVCAPDGPRLGYAAC
jgi:type IV fimbrial biogenesis protein FimT